MSVRISTPRMTTEPSIRLWEERIFGLINSLTGLLTVLMAPRPSRELPPPQVPANWAVLRILAQSQNFFVEQDQTPIMITIAKTCPRLQFLVQDNGVLNIAGILGAPTVTGGKT